VSVSEQTIGKEFCMAEILYPSVYDLGLACEQVIMKRLFRMAGVPVHPSTARQLSNTYLN